MRRDSITIYRIKLDQFIKYLKSNGAEILSVSNGYELLRFKGQSVGVIYNSGKTSGKYCNQSIKDYKSRKKWTGAPTKVKRKGSYSKEKRQLLKRDGNLCFYCIKDLNNDITLEHLISIIAGGSNKLGNMVLAHEKCNHDAGNKPLVDKIQTRIINLLKILKHEQH